MYFQDYQTTDTQTIRTVLLPPLFPSLLHTHTHTLDCLAVLHSNPQVGSRICLSASEYHQETWQPTWTVTSLVSALVAHMTEPAVEIGSIQGATPSQKRAAAASSRSFECPTCGVWHGSFPKEIFPTPPGFIASKKRTPPLDKDIVGGRDTGNRQHSGVKEMQAVDRSALQEGSSLSRIVRLLASKSFLLMLALILASYFLKQTR